MNLLKTIFLLYLVHHASSKSHTKSLTESLGQEIIEIGKIKDLPQDLEEEPSAENDDSKHTTTTIQAATKKEFSKATAIDPNRKVKDIDKIDGRRQDDDEARIEKELADLYKDSLGNNNNNSSRQDYKADSAEVTKEANASVAPAASNASAAADADSSAPELADTPMLRARHEFKFQPDSNNPRDVARFRTSVDEISCDSKLSATKSPNEMNNAAGRLVLDLLLFIPFLYTACV